MEDFFSSTPGLILIYGWYIFAGYVVYSRLIKPISQAVICAAKETPAKIQKTRGLGREVAVFSAFIGIRGARKITGTIGSIWHDAKAADKRVTELERTGAEQIKPEE